jgi:hypothetical protein
MKISEAIKKGSETTRPTVCVLTERDAMGNLYTCALGAAHIGNGGDPDMQDFDISSSLRRNWPELNENAIDPVTGERTALEFIVWDLNDAYGWTRERIANWLAEEEH